MHEPANSESVDVKALWRDQPNEKLPVPSPEGLVLRGRRLHAMTRSEILTTVSALLFFAAVLVWRLGPSHVAMASLALITLWVFITLLWLRRRVWSSADQAFAASGVEFYRRELEQRRIHLRNTWLWHGPLLLACIAIVDVAMVTGTLAYNRLAQVSPLLIALALWTVFRIRQRLRDAKAIKRELDEMAEASHHGRE
jgi:hypothetical protein